MPSIEEQGGWPGIIVSAVQGHYANKAARKQALSDEELHGKINDLIGQRENLVSKASTLKKGTPEYDEAFNALREVDTNLRTIYHHQNNPGAIQKFGHLLTDHLKITNPQKRVEKEGAKRAQGLAGDERQAQLDVAAGPLSPEQQALQGVNADSSKRLAQFNSDIAFHKSQNPHAYGPDATPEEKKMVENYRNERVQFYGQGFTPQAPQGKPGTSALSIGLDSYAKSHGFSSFNDIPNDKRDAVMNYEIRKQALDKAIPQSTTTTTLKQDVNGQWVPVTETNYRTPGENIKLVDPLGNAQYTPAASGEPPTTPKKTSGSKGAGTPSAPKESGATKTGNTKVGAPLFQGRTPAIAKAQNDIVDATKLASIADQVASRPNDAINQKRLAVQLERASAGRFTVQALDYVIKSGWGNTLQQWANNPSTGALPPDIVRQLVNGAHENLKAAQDSLKAAFTPIGGTSQKGNGDEDIEAIVKALNGDKK